VPSRRPTKIAVDYRRHVVWLSMGYGPYKSRTGKGSLMPLDKPSLAHGPWAAG
jgi:hypothetical protein